MFAQLKTIKLNQSIKLSCKLTDQ